MDLMADQRMWTVSAADGQDPLLDPSLHRAEVVLRLLTAGITAATLRAIVPEWSPLILFLDEELRASGTRVLTVG
jgi:hypothetical protein